MSLEELRALKEPFLDSKGYEKGKSTRANCSSYINKLFDFMNEKGYSELNASVISEYLKSYEGTAQLGVRKKRIEEFEGYVKGEKEMNSYDEAKQSEEVEAGIDMADKKENHTPMHESNSDETAESNAPKNEALPEQPVQETLKKRGRKKQADNENRTQISAYLSNEVYAGIKALSVMTQQPISDIVSQVMNAFYEDNIEVVNESIQAIQHSESVKSKIKYRR